MDSLIDPPDLVLQVHFPDLPLSAPGRCLLGECGGRERNWRRPGDTGSLLGPVRGDGHGAAGEKRDAAIALAGKEMGMAGESGKPKPLDPCKRRP